MKPRREKDGHRDLCLQPADQKQSSDMKNQPVYSIDSVDHALHLAAVLQQEGPLRVSEAAERLGVARSTAHRLLAMLVYRDFAEQGPDRRYLAGPVLRHPAMAEPVANLRRAALPYLRELTSLSKETTHVMVVIGDQARLVASVECGQVPRVGDRIGRMFPAHLASGGRAVLATRTDEEIGALYSRPDSPVRDIPQLLRDLRRIRQQGFAINNQATETGLVAIGCKVPGPGDVLPAAVSITMPTVRYRREQLPEWRSRLFVTAERIGRDLHAAAKVQERQQRGTPPRRAG